MKKHKVLFLFYFFPPIASTATRRNTYIFNHLKSYFNDYFVFSTKNQHFFPKDNIYEHLRGNDEKLTLLTTIDFRTIGNWFRSRKSSLKKTIHLDENIKKYKVVQIFQKMLDGFPFNLILQEGGIIYSCMSIYKGYRLIKKEKITHVWSSFRPYSDHFSAYILKRLLPDLIWIADFRDLHVEPLYQNVYFVPFQHWCNRQIVKRADIVTTISEGLANHLKAYNNSVHVLRSGIVVKNKISNTPKMTKFSIVYTGAMFRDERNPTLLMEVVKELSDNGVITSENFAIVYAGRDSINFQNYIDRFDLNNFFENKGMLTTQEAINLQNSAHVNLLLTSATPEWTGVMTGKLGEYLSTKKPLVVLINGTKDSEYEELINDLNAGCVVYNNHSFNALRSFILEKFNEWQNTGEVKPTIDTEKLKELSWEKQVQKFVEHIKL